MNSHVSIMTGTFALDECLSSITPFQAFLKVLGKEAGIRFA